MNLDCLKNAQHYVTGAKQTLKAIQSGKASHVFVAADAEERVLRPILESCTERAVPVSSAATMVDLGKACGIKVKAAAAAVLSAD
jgi:large subunit ribosomal protein L7A